MSPSVCIGKPSPSIYHLRQPRSSPLFRHLEEHLDRFGVIYEEEFERGYGRLHVEAVMNRRGRKSPHQPYDPAEYMEKIVPL